MNIDLTGKFALVRGASQGIGRAIAEELGALGATVTLVARDEAKLKDVLKGLSRSKNQAHDYVVLDSSDTKRLESETSAKFGGAKSYHILINNTGGPPAGLASDAKPEEFAAAFSSHLLANQIFTQAVLPSMKNARYGRIINIISTSVKEPIAGLGVSNTIRAAVANWAKTLARELGPHGITVNNLLPGATKTQRLEAIFEGRAKKSGKPIEEVISHSQAEIPMGRFADPSEIAAAVAFLATPAASYITGINLTVDGGRTASL